MINNVADLFSVVFTDQKYLVFGRTHNISKRRLAAVSAVFPVEEKGILIMVI